jgi:hypothetical protein
LSSRIQLLDSAQLLSLKTGKLVYDFQQVHS